MTTEEKTAHIRFSVSRESGALGMTSEVKMTYTLDIQGTLEEVTAQAYKFVSEFLPKQLTHLRAQKLPEDAMIAIEEMVEDLKEWLDNGAERCAFCESLSGDIHIEFLALIQPFTRRLSAEDVKAGALELGPTKHV